MLETDPSSRLRLGIIAGVFVVLFGGFALFGMIQQRVSGSNLPSELEKPAPMPSDYWVRLAERREEFAVRNAQRNGLEALGQKGKWEAAIARAEAVLAKRDDRVVRLLRAEARLRLGVPEAGKELVDFSQNGMEPGDAALLRGDTEEYRRRALDALARIDAGKATPLERNNAAWRAAVGDIGPDPAMLAKAVRFSEESVQATRTSEQTEEQASLATYLNTLGAVYYRAGRDADAVRTLTEAEALQKEPFNYPFLAMASHRLGNVAEAQRWRTRLNDYLTKTYSWRRTTQDRAELLLLWREMDQTLASKP